MGPAPDRDFASERWALGILALWERSEVSLGVSGSSGGLAGASQVVRADERKLREDLSLRT